jgi:hypothetical protein
MPRGGARPGAGRPRGVSKLTSEALEYARLHDALPVSFMLNVMLDTTQPISVRLQAAMGAAPYLTPKLTANTNLNLSVAPSSDAKARLAAFLERLAAPTIDLSPATTDTSKVTEAQVIELPVAKQK